MKKTNILLTLLGMVSLIIGLFGIALAGNRQVPILFPEEPVIEQDIFQDDIETLYKEMQLEDKVSYDAFRQGIYGFNRIDSKRKNILALVDFSKPSTEERLFIFDLEKKEVLFMTHVSHGRNSGDKYATSFSNREGSYQSSLGFYLTDQTYQGKNGYSLRLDGLEAGINDRARERAIVMHGAPYANPSIIAANGRLGRSLGCPAVPEALTRPVIDTLKDGAVLYIFADHPEYRQQSDFVG